MRGRPRNQQRIDAIVAYDAEGLSSDEVAEALGLSKDTLQTFCRRNDLVETYRRMWARAEEHRILPAGWIEAATGQRTRVRFKGHDEEPPLADGDWEAEYDAEHPDMIDQMVMVQDGMIKRWVLKESA